MSHKQLRIHKTDLDNLISNLRGEVGEIISTWILMRIIMGEANNLRTSDIEKDLANSRLSLLDNLIDKLSDEIIARLSELAEQKVGRLTFHFAQMKLVKFEREVKVFERFIKKNRFHKKRNYDISHKELPEQWSDHKNIHIRYITLLKGMVIALRLMKKFDIEVLGPSARYMWREMRRRRYSPTSPAKVGYMLLPYFWPSEDDRLKIIQEEMREGRQVWEDMQIKVNGVETNIKACGRWGAIAVPGHPILLVDPFVELTSIEFPSEDNSANDDT